MKNNNPKIFLSYSLKDNHEANIIAEALSTAGLDVYYDQFNINHENSLTDMIYKSVKSSDYFIVLLSNESIKSNWVLYELNEVLSKELYYRDIVIVPVILSRCKLPESLRNRKRFDLSSNFEKGLNNLVSYLKNIPYLNFNVLSPILFKELIMDLLKKLKFRIDKVYNGYQDYGYDIKAKHKHRNPFGSIVEDNWIFQLKLYNNSRADITSLKQLSFFLSDNYCYQGALITNGQLTSAARKWLVDNEKIEKTRITIIDGVQLKELLLKYPDLITKYFHREEGLYE